MNSTILLVEDEKDIREYVTDVLSDNGYTTYAAGTGYEGLKLVEKLGPDLVILDLKLPDLDGLSVCKQIKADYPEMPILILTAKDTPEDIAHGLNIGADDYLPKPFAAEVLLARIRARLRAQTQENTVLQVDSLTLNPQTHEVKRGEEIIQLSPQEFKLLYYLMVNKNKVLTREMILSRIWGSSPDIETRVVDVYVGYLRKKIDRGERKKLFESVRGFGYKLRE